MLQASPHVTAALWPITPDAAALRTIVHAQAQTIADQEVLIDDYQEVLSNAQAPPPTGATATATGTALALTAIINGPVLIGSVVTGIGVPATPPTIIIAQTSGTAGATGTYTTNQATTCASAAVLINPGGSPSSWPTPSDADTLNLIVQAQTAIIRTQTALLQQYQDLLNTSQTPAP